MDFDAQILDLKRSLIFFPVRHHSPMAARCVRELALQARPTAVLIEGPADFNDKLDELYLPHRLPLAIYSYWRSADGTRGGAYYPFCEYSPEWAALQVARELAAHVEFIDLPWQAVAHLERRSNAYADGALRSREVIAALCQRLGTEDFDGLWDKLIEVDDGLSVEQYLARCHRFCYECRDAEASPADLQREAFMAQRIRAAREKYDKILIVTGGFHSSALFHALQNEVPEQVTEETENAPPTVESGIALTPYSYERLDGLTGYDSGMPNPGFYHRVWLDRAQGAHREHGAGASYRHLLADAAAALRQRKQAVSTADLIAVEATAQGLARLRGHAQVWRRDVLDGITGALVKDEIADGLTHPFLAAVHEVFRGSQVGRLADGTALPPLVHDIRQLLQQHDLEPNYRERQVSLELPAQVSASRVLHALRVLGVRGFQKTGGTDFAARLDLSRLWEEWRFRWTPEFEASCIESAVYGPTLEAAAQAKLTERCAAVERNAEAAALILLDAALAGLAHHNDETLTARLAALVREDGNFVSVAAALEHLLYLYRYDEVCGTVQQLHVGELLAETYQRSLWLLENTGNAAGDSKRLLRGLSVMLQTFQRCGAELGLSREEFVECLQRTGRDHAHEPVLSGATVGTLWVANAATKEDIQAGLRFCAGPERLGDFLTGLFALAREAVQREAELLTGVDELVLAFGDEQFLEALPALRLAFTYFTPREKHHLARSLLQAVGQAEVEPLPDLAVSVEVAARALAWETRLFQMMERYGLSSPDKSVP